MELGLYSVNSAAVIPHSVAREAQVSPDATWTVVQVPELRERCFLS